MKIHFIFLIMISPLLASFEISNQDSKKLKINYSVAAKFVENLEKCFLEKDIKYSLYDTINCFYIENEIKLENIQKLIVQITGTNDKQKQLLNSAGFQFISNINNSEFLRTQMESIHQSKNLTQK